MQSTGPTFTDAARAQLRAWTQLSAEAVAGLFSQGKTVLLGSEPFSNWVRHLFFCEPELHYLVLVHESVTNNFVAVLPAEVGSELGITDKKMRRAVRLQNELLHHQLFCIQTLPERGVRLKINGRFLDRSGAGNTQCLGSFRLPDLPADMKNVIGNHQLIESLRLKVLQKGLDWNALYELLLTDGEQFYLTVELP